MSFGKINFTQTPSDLQSPGAGNSANPSTSTPEDSVTGDSTAQHIFEALLRYIRRLTHTLAPKENSFSISFSGLPVNTVYTLASGGLPNAGSRPFRSVIISLDGNLTSVGIWLGNQAGNAPNLPSWLKSYAGESSQQYHINTTIVGDVTIFNNGSNPVSGTISFYMW